MIARDAVIWPVPPLAIAIVVPVHVPVVIVPTVAMSVPTKFDAAIEPANIALVTAPAAIVVVIEDVPLPVTFPESVIVPPPPPPAAQLHTVPLVVRKFPDCPV